MANLSDVAKNLKEAPGTLRTTVCVFGAPKSGKSEAIARLAEAGFNLIWIDIENGWEVLLKLSPEAQKRVTLLRLPDSKGWPIAIKSLLRLVKGNKLLVCEEHGAAEVAGCPVCRKEGKPMTEIELGKLDANTIVVIDSGTQLSTSAMNHITQNKPDDYKPERDDWGNLGKLLDGVLSYVQAGRFHCIVTAHETELEMDDGKVKLVPSIGTRNFARNCAKYFSHIVHTEVKNRGHIAASGTTYAPNVLTGSRTDVKLEDAKTEYKLAEIFRHYSKNM